jgi:preprotein translocase subunit YajC
MTPLAQMIQLVVLTSLALGAVYFIFYRPTVEAQNRQRRVVAGLRPGDEIVTTSGFIARLLDVREDERGEVELLLDLGGITVRARPSAVAERLPRPERAEEAQPRPPAVDAPVPEAEPAAPATPGREA